MESRLPRLLNRGKTLPDNRPIGVFDSGVGGLTVLRALQEALPLESTIYLGDLARCPYGSRPQQEVTEYALQISDYLARQDIKLLVIACNTATAAALHLLEQRYSFPVIGVIRPGAEAALEASLLRRIGVIATDGTVASGAYVSEMLARRLDVHVAQRAASWLVPVIENGETTRKDVRERLSRVVQSLLAENVDTMILGCTHFPLIRDLFQREAGRSVRVVDSAHTSAVEVSRLLSLLQIESDSSPTHRIFVTGPALAFQRRAETMFRTRAIIEPIDLLLDLVRAEG
jgi:glutamate racemase